MSRSDTLSLPKGFSLTMVADENTTGSYIYMGNPGEGSILVSHIDASSTTIIGPFNEQRYYNIISDTGAITHSQECSGIYTKNDETNVSDFLVRVDALDDLPTPVSGVITLDSDKAYQFTKAIDLLGSRLVGGDNTAILGTSSETSSITSTGLGTGVALFTTTGTTPIQNITFKDVDTAFSINGGGTAAYDWSAFNISSVPNIGTIQNVDNWIYTNGAILSSQGLIFTGTAGTIGISNSLLTGDGSSGSIIEIASGCTVSRRFRIIYSSIVASSSTTGVDVNASAVVPVEGYILDTVNFAGNGTFTSGVAFSDNKAKFVQSVGVTNSTNAGAYFMVDNSTETTISTIDTAVKVLGTTTGSTLQRFTHTNNKLVYVGAITRTFRVSANTSFSSGNNKVISIYIAKNGSTLAASQIPTTTSGNGKAESISVQTLIELAEDDYIEIYIENNSGTTNITVEFLNVLIEAAL